MSKQLLAWVADLPVVKVENLTGGVLLEECRLVSSLHGSVTVIDLKGFQISYPRNNVVVRYRDAVEIFPQVLE